MCLAPIPFRGRIRAVAALTPLGYSVGCSFDVRFERGSRTPAAGQIAVIMNAPTSNSPGAVLGALSFDPSRPKTSTPGAVLFDKEWLNSIRDRLDSNENRLPKRIVATVEEDYWQLLKDLGLTIPGR